jgi:uncharacterized protein (DUF433 family)
MSGDLSENEVDNLVIEQAENDNAWETPIFVNRKRMFSLLSSQPDEIVSEKEILSGEPIFRGTRVPVSALLDNLEAGVSLDEFLVNFPSVKREQAVQILEYFKSSLDRFKDAA